MWSPTGRELFYLDAGPRLVAADVQAGSTFGVGRLVPLFDVSSFVNDFFHQGYAAAPDGRSFLFMAPRRLTVTGRAVPIVWVDHWFTDLAARVKP